MEPSKFSPSLLVSPLLLFLVILLASLPQSTEQTYMNMTRGTFLSPSPSGPNSSLVSPSGNFAFGFRAYNSDESLFLLAIWFNSTSPQHVIWFAMNQGNPILASIDSKLRLNQDGLLALTSSDGTQIWSSNINDADHATLLDSGNFVICNTICDSNSLPLWESFQYPTDTIVPGQVLSSGQVLWSKLTDSDFSQGRFNLIIQDNHDLVLYPVSLPTRDRYHALWRPTNQNCDELVFNSNGSLYCQYADHQMNVTVPAAYSTLDYYQHATVDPDGLFRIYAYSKKNIATGWEVIEQNYPDDCFAWNIDNTSPTGQAGGGVCGVNGYCSLNDPNQTQVHCKCPLNYSVIDPDDIYKGCKPDFEVQQCGSAHETREFQFLELLNTDWQSDDYEWYKSFSEDQCKDNCLKDCSCAVAIHKSNGNTTGCHKKALPLQLGIQGNVVDGKVFIKVPKRKDGFHIGSVAGVILLVAASILLVMVVVVLWKMNFSFYS